VSRGLPVYFAVKKLKNWNRAKSRRNGASNASTTTRKIEGGA
jgi:hypothetical protein